MTTPEAAPPETVLFTLDQLGSGAAPFLCDQLAALLLEHPSATTVLCDVSGLARPTPHDLNHLARLHSTAQRMGRALRLRNPGPRLVLLLELTGLDDVLRYGPSTEPAG